MNRIKTWWQCRFGIPVWVCGSDGRVRTARLFKASGGELIIMLDWGTNYCAHADGTVTSDDSWVEKWWYV